MTTKRGHVIGAIMLAKSGDVAVFGPLSDPRLGALVLERRWLSDLKARRVSTLQLDDIRYTVLDVPTEAGDLLLFSTGAPDPVLRFMSGVDFAYEVMEHLLADPGTILAVVDRDGQLSYLSQNHEALFSTSGAVETGRPARDVVENIQLDRVLGTGKEETGDLQHVRGVPRLIDRSPIHRDGKLVGAVGRISISELEQVETLTHRIAELERENAFLRMRQTPAQPAGAYPPAFAGTGEAVIGVKADISKYAPLDLGTLIEGEYGAGRYAAALTLHRHSPRRDGPFVPVCLTSLPAVLHEAELFGHAPGAVPGGDPAGAAGKLEQADGGVLYLDDVTALSPALQDRLLQALRRRESRRIGAADARPIDVRLIAATTETTTALATADGMNSDFLNHVGAARLTIPPLRERTSDIADVATAYLSELGMRTGKAVPELAPDAVTYLRARNWPGNVQELFAELDSAFHNCVGPVLHGAEFGVSRGRTRKAGADKPGSTKGLHAAMDALGMDLILDALERCGGNKKKAAAQLGISRSYLYKRLAEAEQPSDPQ